ncbi:hypothetical protein HanHA89_Chr13g0535601 [Helianthus annuus]|nr:hypothetical protein HanHA89_Chr13g0535601 [Helianthus annuus]
MGRWSGILKVPLFPGSRSHYKVATSLCISTSSQKPVVPSMNAIFFNGDRVRGTGNPVIEKLSDLEAIAEIIVSKLGEDCNVWVIEASKFNGPFAVYKDFIPSVNKWGEPNSYDPTGDPACTSTVSLLSSCLKEVNNTLSSRNEESCGGEALGSCLSHPKTLLFGFSKGGTVINQLVTELAFSDVKSNTLSSQHETNIIIPTSKESLLNSITEIHYVDVGLNSSGAYITDQDVIERVSKRISERALGIRFVLHGTPRQWRDSMRVWIGKEKDTMVDLLDVESRKSGGKLSFCERFYFGDKMANMQMHFEVIEKMDVS